MKTEVRNKENERKNKNKENKKFQRKPMQTVKTPIEKITGKNTLQL